MPYPEGFVPQWWECPECGGLFLDSDQEQQELVSSDEGPGCRDCDITMLPRGPQRPRQKLRMFDDVPVHREYAIRAHERDYILSYLTNKIREAWRQDRFTDENNINWLIGLLRSVP